MFRIDVTVLLSQQCQEHVCPVAFNLWCTAVKRLPVVSLMRDSLLWALQPGVTHLKILCVGQVRESHSGLPYLLLLPTSAGLDSLEKIYWSRQSFWEELQHVVLYFYFSGHQGFLPFNSIACPDVSALCTPSCGLLWQLLVQTSFCSLWLLLPAGTVG